MEPLQDQVFNLFANCIPVKGINRSIICDVYRGRFRIIPNALYIILTKFRKNTLTEIKEYFEQEHAAFIDEYFDFLKQNEFGFFCSKEEQKRFPKLNIEHETASIISNCIIDINKHSTYDFRKLFLELEKLHCHFWQIRVYGDFSLAEIEDVLRKAEHIHLNSIHLIMSYHESMSPDKIVAFYDRYPIVRVDFYAVPLSLIGKYILLCKPHPLQFHEKKIVNETHCGNITAQYFNPNLKLFSESQQHNSCLNQKISVDVNGEIKNCPSMAKSYGNIKNTSLKEALDKKGFKDVWNINKNKILVCKDCEFRHICTDCRAYIEDPADIHSKPLKCGYNPYTTKWEKWSKNPLSKKVIQHYGMQEIV
jgi:SPASM domain peptide maturase of grasp-with-spasm system